MAKDGNVIFVAPVVPLPAKNSIFFRILIAGENLEFLRISPDGFYVKGVKVEPGETEPQVVYEAMLEFLKLTGALPR